MRACTGLTRKTTNATRRQFLHAYLNIETHVPIHPRALELKDMPPCAL